ncbi:retinoid-inducible serine carboxypeptidase-like [Rhynchophorus ferrugineus]|uniref:Retinoid-inducible serine carboxypeptidase n=1 Tax=Rhynchophorus ferrugineus TaxID=354439 RepID=A0A834ME11_RHYFE|nr:hypothetical protein GWI33_005203 [Rhynchophorus ferrugineus]
MMLLIILVCCLCGASGKTGFGPTDQDWGFEEIRNGSYLFWWLHYTTATANYLERPLIIWLQGGPGGSSTGYGNFIEIGPWDQNLEVRNTSWVNYANILFVDNPVGTGFSYTDTYEYATTNEQVAEDFVEFLKGFYNRLPKFEDVPLYIFCESYGGKMTVEIALKLSQEIKAAGIRSNFKGVGLGDSWISPLDSVLSWAPYLYNLGFVDTQGYNYLTDYSQNVKNAIELEDWGEATNSYQIYQTLIESFTLGVDFYNVLTKVEAYAVKRPVNVKVTDPGPSITELMNGPVKEALNISGDWGIYSSLVFYSLQEDFMKPVTDVLEQLLNETDIKVGIYNGQLDLIVPTPGTINWMDKLNFKDAESWKNSISYGLVEDEIYEGIQRDAGNLSFFWVFRSGHMVPSDNPKAMYHILKEITNNFT